MLEVLSRFQPDLPQLMLTGTYDDTTVQAVRAFQNSVGLPDTGAVDAATWDAIYSQYAAVETEVFPAVSERS